MDDTTSKTGAFCVENISVGISFHWHKPISQIPQCTCPIPHNAPHWSRNMNICLSLCDVLRYIRKVHCQILPISVPTRFPLGLRTDALRDLPDSPIIGFVWLTNYQICHDILSTQLTISSYWYFFKKYGANVARCLGWMKKIMVWVKTN